MNRLMLAGFALAVFVAPAMAADMPLKARPAPAPAWSWTGLYVGINGGGSVGNDSSTASFTGTPVPVLEFNEAFGRSLAGAVFGGQIGYNWHVAPQWVIGVEGDWDWTGQKNSACLFGCGPNFFGPTSGTFMFDDQSLKWVATARGRLGYADGTTLWYVTGGGAWGRFEESITAGGTTASLQTAASFSTTKSGWTIGGGVETALWHSGWSAKLEYLYVDLGTITNAYATPATNFLGTGIVASSSRVQDHIFRIGLNYRFGGYGPVMPSVMPSR
jgi:outer membrane immunogenic protein